MKEQKKKEKKKTSARSTEAVIVFWTSSATVTAFLSHTHNRTLYEFYRWSSLSKISCFLSCEHICKGRLLRAHLGCRLSSIKRWSETHPITGSARRFVEPSISANWLKCKNKTKNAIVDNAQAFSPTYRWCRVTHLEPGNKFLRSTRLHKLTQNTNICIHTRISRFCVRLVCLLPFICFTSLRAVFHCPYKFARRHNTHHERAVGFFLGCVFTTSELPDARKCPRWQFCLETYAAWRIERNSFWFAEPGDSYCVANREFTGSVNMRMALKSKLAPLQMTSKYGSVFTAPAT